MKQIGENKRTGSQTKQGVCYEVAGAMLDCS